MSALRRRQRPDAALRLGWIALALLLFAAAALAWNTQEQLRGMRQESERVRAQLMADSLSQRIGHALDIGIPLEALVGVEALFKHRLAAHAEIRSIALLRGPDQVLWNTERDKAPREGEGAGAVADAPIVVHGESRGTVRLTLRESGRGAFVRTAATLLLPTVLLLAALAFLAARFSQAQGVSLRNHAVRLAMRAIASGRYDRSVVLPHRRAFDLRAQQLGHAVRGVHETLTRVRRLMSSLRQTEPQAQRREYLDMLMAEAQGHQRFAEHGLVQVRVVAAEAQAFWVSLMVTLSAAALLGLATAATHADLATNAGTSLLVPSLFVAAAAVAAWFTQGLRWPVLTVLFVVCGGLGLLACTTAFGVLGTHNNVLMRLSGLALGCGAFVGAALCACSTVEQDLSRQDYKHAMPRWHRASLSAWLGATVWLGPAMGSVTFAALGDVYGVLALTLPILCAGFLLVRWNEPRSPWRYRVSAHRAALEATLSANDSRALGVVGGVAVAIGLLVAQAWTAAPHSLADTVVACALGVGVLLGVMDPLRRRRQQAATLAAAVCLNALVLFAPDTASWILPVQMCAALLTAYLVGHATASTQRRLSHTPSVTLVGAAVGLLLAAGLLAAGGPPTSLGLVAALVLSATGWAQPRAQPWQPAPKDSDAA